METFKTLNLADDLVGVLVSAPPSRSRLGRIEDAVVHPTDGRLIALALRSPEGDERVVSACGLTVGEGSVSVVNGAPSGGTGTARYGVRALRDLRGVNVVTDEGQLLGRVSEVRISPCDGRVFYRVAETGLRRLLGGGFMMEGSAAHSYSRAGSRLIVDTLAPACEPGDPRGEGIRVSTSNWIAESAALHAFLYRNGVLLWFLLLFVLLWLLLWW